MRKTLCSLIGIVLFALGIALLVIIVPRMLGNDLHVGDYVWAFVIIVTCSMGFGLTVAGVFWEEDQESGRDGDASHDGGRLHR